MQDHTFHNFLELKKIIIVFGYLLQLISLINQMKNIMIDMSDAHKESQVMQDDSLTINTIVLYIHIIEMHIHLHSFIAFVRTETK